MTQTELTKDLKRQAVQIRDMVREMSLDYLYQHGPQELKSKDAREMIKPFLREGIVRVVGDRVSLTPKGRRMVEHRRLMKGREE